MTPCPDDLRRTCGTDASGGRWPGRRRCFARGRRIVLLVWLALAAASTAACSRKEDTPAHKAADEPDPNARTVVMRGSPRQVQFAVAWSTDPAPAVAGREATESALQAVGNRAKAVVFVTYYEVPGFQPDPKRRHRAIRPDHGAEDLVARAVAEACGTVPSIGCRARPLTNHGTMLRNAVAVLAIAGDMAKVTAAKAAITPDRLATGRALAKGLGKLSHAEMLLVLGEMKLSFDPDPNVRADDFLRGVLADARKDVVLWGGNAMPDDDRHGGSKAGKQFYGGRPLTGHVVALALAGPMAVFANQGHEFEPTIASAEVTETRGKWVVKLDGKPAEMVYRNLVGLRPGEKLTSDWLHAMGMNLGAGRTYVRMILNWVHDGKDKDDVPVDLPDGSLLLAGELPRGTKLVGLICRQSPARIVGSARQAVGESVARAGDVDAAPALCLISDCCTRGMRLRLFAPNGADEVLQGVVPAFGRRYSVPIFGFYAWGEVGRVRGPYMDLHHQHQQHVFVSALVGISP